MTTPRNTPVGPSTTSKYLGDKHGANVETIVKTSIEFLSDIVGEEHEIVK
jgi:hypothetical protein